MTKRDRIVILVILSAGVLAALWFVALGPKRDESTKLDGRIAAEQLRLSSAQTGTATARDAKARYENDYAAVARLGQAVPADENTASLVYELDHAAGRAQIDFRSLSLEAASSSGQAGAAPAPADPAAAGPGAGTAPATGATGADGATAPAAPPVDVNSFPTMPFSFELEGSFFHLESFLRRVAAFTRVKGKHISVSGRLISITGIQISASKKGVPRIGATVKGTAYVLPSSEGLTNGATPAAPALASATTPAAPGAAAPAAPAAAAIIAGGGK